MKRFVCLLVCLLMTVTLFAQMTQKGVAYRYNGKNKRTPLGNVTISYDNNRRTAVSGEQDGTFSLTLTGYKMGDRIGVVTVKKREMMVFNQHAVDEWSVRKEPLTLILCNADEFERQKQNLIAIGRREAKKKYDRQKAELEAKLSASEIQRAEYEEKLDKAYEQLELLQKNIGEYADALARIDQSELDAQMQEVLELYECGHVEEAIQKLDDMRLKEQFTQTIERRQFHQQGLEAATRDSALVISKIRDAVTLYKNTNEWEKAAEYLKLLADRLNTVDDCWNYAFFCRKQNNFSDAEHYYHRAISLLDSQTADKEAADYLSQRGSLLNGLATLYYTTRRFDAAEPLYEESLKIRRRLALANPHAYGPDVAATLNGLANLYSDTQRLDAAEPLYEESLEICRRLASVNPQAYEPDVAVRLHNLAFLYSDTQRFDAAEALYKESLEIRRRLALANPQAYEPNVAQTLNNLATLYNDTRRFDAAETMFTESLEIYRRLASANLQAYEPGVARTLDGLATLYYNTQRFDAAEPLYKESLEIRRRLASANPQAYEFDVAQTQYNIGLLKIKQEKYSEAIPHFVEALDFNRKLARVNSAQQHWYEGSLYWLSKLYSSQNDYKGAYRINQELISVLKQEYDTDSDSWKSPYTETLGSQSFCAIFMKKYSEAEQLARGGLSINSTQHWIASNLAAALLFQGKYAEAESIYRQYKDELKDSFLDDFRQFAEAGVIPEERKEDVEKIKKMLNE